MGSHQQQQQQQQHQQQQSHEMYYDSGHPAARSPGSLRHQPQQQSLNRANSRQFDPFGQMPAGLYTVEDHTVGFQTNRFDRMGAGGGGMGGAGGGPFPGPNSYAYDMTAGAQTWNPNGFGGGGAGNGLAQMGATGRIKPTPRRSQLPTVSHPPVDRCTAGILPCQRRY
jgi:hypothetical protein